MKRDPENFLTPYTNLIQALLYQSPAKYDSERPNKWSAHLLLQISLQKSPFSALRSRMKSGVQIGTRSIPKRPVVATAEAEIHILNLHCLPLLLRLRGRSAPSPRVCKRFYLEWGFPIKKDTVVAAKCHFVFLVLLEKKRAANFTSTGTQSIL